MKKIKFPLEMAEGTQVRELEELQQYFDLERAIEYFSNGKLQKWLANTYNDDILEEIEQLTGREENFISKFTSALGVDNDKKNLNVQKVINKSLLREKLKEFFPNEKVEEIAPFTVETQEELERLSGKKCKKIYLLQNKFYISKDMKNIYFIGIGNPQIEVEAEERKDFEKQKIRLKGVKPINEDTKKIIMADDYKATVLDFLDVLESYVESVG